MDIKDKIKDNIKITENGCWEWQKAINRSGYGIVKFKGSGFGVHRVSFGVFKHAIPEGLNVCHSCDNRKCCNPDHLFLGTQLENIRDKIDKGRQYTKLSLDEVLSIRHDTRTQKVIAKEYGVSQMTISRIKHDKSWIGRV